MNTLISYLPFIGSIFGYYWKINETNGCDQELPVSLPPDIYFVIAHNVDTITAFNNLSLICKNAATGCALYRKYIMEKHINDTIFNIYYYNIVQHKMSSFNVTFSDYQRVFDNYSKHSPGPKYWRSGQIRIKNIDYLIV